VFRRFLFSINAELAESVNENFVVINDGLLSELGRQISFL